MSTADREKWDRRYREGAYSERTHPSAFLQQWLDRLPVGRALDVACGAGRNALYLAHHGFEVDGIDISSEALARGRARADEQGLAINWLERDLDEPLDLAPGYRLVVMVRYVNLPLLRQLSGLLAPGGLLLCEEHLQTDADVIGPRSPRFRVEPGALRDIADGLQVLHLEEGLVTEPDGQVAALAQLVARK